MFYVGEGWTPVSSDVEVDGVTHSVFRIGDSNPELYGLIGRGKAN